MTRRESAARWTAAGLYVHVPFCLRKCHYCDFNSAPGDEAALTSYLYALGQEMHLYRRELSTGFQTIYVGGGTPTVLPIAGLIGLIEAARQLTRLGESAEVTVEANPGTITQSALHQMRGAGVNRLSIGAQSFDDGLLRTMGRAHCSRDIYDSVLMARSAGFENLNLDLIFGLPGQTAQQWQSTLHQALALEPEHLSCYSLIVEPGTRLSEQVSRQEVTLPDEDTELWMYEYTIEQLQSVGYEHYEVSNFALPDRRGLHNVCYWHNGEYLGLGPGAASHWRGERFRNIPALTGYCAALRQGCRPIEDRQLLTREERMDDTLMMGLRLLEGVSAAVFETRFGESLTTVYPHQIEQLTNQGLVTYDGSILRLTHRGLLLGNHVFGAFLRRP